MNTIQLLGKFSINHLLIELTPKLSNGKSYKQKENCLTLAPLFSVMAIPGSSGGVQIKEWRLGRCWSPLVPQIV
jgi:hypothetical protein